MKNFQNIALGLFVCSMAMLISLLFLDRYQLNENAISASFDDRYSSYLDFDDMENRVYDNKFNFVADLNASINLSNERIADHNNQANNETQLNALRAGSLVTLVKHSNTGFVSDNNVMLLWVIFSLGLGAALAYILPKFLLKPGIKNDHIYHSKNKARGWIGYSIGGLLIIFYVILYWFPEYMTEWLILVDPISLSISGNEASQWFFYGLLYTLAILVMGVRMFAKYQHSKYHQVRTASVMFFQTAFAFTIPEILVRLQQPYFNFMNIWPLNYDFFFDYKLSEFISSGSLGIFMLFWGILLILVAVPLFSYFYGKRWYCSWICGCGGLAETLGDPYRQLSDKSLGAWKVERWMIHSVLVLAVVMTAGVLYTFFTGSATLLFIDTYYLRYLYGFFIGAAFAGVVGVGFYPMMGNRVWCRFGCPLAAYIGIIQRFKSRFRITTNGGQCISCGNCSTYCEMGIDVRWYAQRGQNIVRASCVGCGVCSSVCPRGVLKLENKSEKGRFNEAILIGHDNISLGKQDV